VQCRKVRIAITCPSYVAVGADQQRRGCRDGGGAGHLRFRRGSQGRSPGRLAGRDRRRAGPSRGWPLAVRRSCGPGANACSLAASSYRSVRARTSRSDQIASTDEAVRGGNYRRRLPGRALTHAADSTGMRQAEQRSWRPYAVPRRSAPVADASGRAMAGAARLLSAKVWLARRRARLAAARPRRPCPRRGCWAGSRGAVSAGIGRSSVGCDRRGMCQYHRAGSRRRRPGPDCEASRWHRLYLAQLRRQRSGKRASLMPQEGLHHDESVRAC
jgi:hypothetical protein